MKRKFIADIKRSRTDHDLAREALPKPLAELFAKHARGEAGEDEVCAALSPYLTANFVKENVSAIDEILDVPEEVDAVHVKVWRAYFPEGAVLPTVNASAEYELETRVALDDDTLMEWQEEHDFLTDAVNFAWSFPNAAEGGFDGWLTSHEGAGFGLADAIDDEDTNEDAPEDARADDE